MVGPELVPRASSRGSGLAMQILVATLLAQPVLHMLTKVTLHRGFLYLAMLLPAIGLGLVAFQRERIPLSRQASFLLLALYIATLLAASALGTDPKAAASVLATKYSAAAAFFLAWLGTRKSGDIRTLLRTILAVGCLSAIYSIWQQSVGFPEFETAWAWSIGNVHGVDIFLDEARRSTGIAIYSGTNSLLLTHCLLLLVALPIDTPGSRLQRIAWMLVFGLALLFSQTRGIWLGAFAGILSILVAKRILAGKSLLGLLPILVLQSALILVAYLASPVVQSRIHSFRGMFTDPTHPFLFRILSTWIPTLRSHPPNLIGFGPGTVQVADNMYLQTLTSVGLLGLAAFLALHAILWVTSFRRARSCATSDSWTATFYTGFSGIVVAQLVAYITGDYLLATPANLVFWALAGAATARLRIFMPSSLSREPTPSPTSPPRGSPRPEASAT